MSNPIVSGSIGGVPAITYLRIQPPIALNNSTASQSISQMISVDGNVVIIPSDGIHYPQSTRHEVAAVLDRNLSDEDVCEHVVGDLAGASSNGDDTNVKGLLNPVRAFVNDAASATLLVVGSKSTRKGRFFKKTLLPFVANEIFSCMNKVNDFSGSEINGEVVDIQLSVSSFEIQDEIVSDLLRPQSRGLSINMGIFDGVRVRGLFIQPVTDETTLRRILNESCDNRVSHAQPLGGNIDSSCAIWQFELTQRVANSQGKLSICYSRLILIDVPSVDVLAELPSGSNNQTSQLKHLQSLSLHKSLVSLVEVIKRLATHPTDKIDTRSDRKVENKATSKVAPKGYTKAHLAPFESSNLTMFLSEVLGGDSLIIGIGLLADGESRVTRRTIDLINALALTTHFPVSNRRDNDRGVADLVKGLVCKYRSMILALQDQLLVNDNKSSSGDGNSNTQELEKKIDTLQKDVLSLNAENAEIKRDRDAVIEVLDLLKSKYQTLLSDKLLANETIIRLEDEKSQLTNELTEKINEIDSNKKSISELNDQIVAKNELIEKCNSEIENFKIDKQQVTEVLNNEKSSNDSNLAIIQKLRESLVNEEERSLELGAEVITLSNQIEEINKQRELDKQANIPLANQIDKLNIEIDRLKEQVNDRDTAIDKYKSLKESKYSKRILSPEASNKSIKELKKQLDRQIDDCNRYRKVNSQLVNEIESLRSDYRSRIERAIIYGERNTKGDKNDFTSEEEELLTSLMTSFNKRESQLVESVKSLETEYETYKLLCRTLYDKLDECVDRFLVDKQADINQLDSEKQLIDECKQQLINAETLLTKPLDDRLDIQSLNDSTDHQKLLLLVHSYKRHVYQSESRLAESQRQVADLSIQLQQLMKQKQLGNEIDRGVDRLPVIQTPKKELNVSQSLSMLPSNNQIRKDSISSDYKLTIQFKDSERKSIELNQKNISLETELNDYKQYMRSTVLQYKRQIETLAKQLDIQTNKLTN